MSLKLEPRHLIIVKDILKKYDYSFFAFGSRVTGNNKTLSDLDLFYLEYLPNRILLKLEDELENSDLPFNIDLVAYHKCDPDFQKLMLQNYICLQSSAKLKLSEKIHLDLMLFVSQKLGFTVEEINGIKVINSNSKENIFNIAYGIPKDFKNDSYIEEIKKAFSQQAFTWWIPPSKYNPEIIKTLLNNNFKHKRIEYSMLHDLTNINVLKQKPDLLLKPIADKAILRDFINILETCENYAANEPKSKAYENFEPRKIGEFECLEHTINTSS